VSVVRNTYELSVIFSNVANFIIPVIRDIRKYGRTLGEICFARVTRRENSVAIKTATVVSVEGGRGRPKKKWSDVEEDQRRSGRT